MRFVILGLAVVVGVGLLVWLGMMPLGEHDTSQATTTKQVDLPLRIGVIPERDIFAQRKRYRALADYLSEQLSRPVQLVTVNSYENVIRDFGQREIDAAFLGSLVAVLAFDRQNARIIVKPQLPGNIDSYRGVVIVPESSPIKSFDDLAGRSIAMVRTTTGGNLYPMYELITRRLLGGDNPPRIVWVGTHDDVILEVLDCRADAGALKDLRLDEFEKTHPEFKFRRLGASQSVPENGLAVRADLAEQLGPKLRDVLLKMDSTPRGREVLEAFGAERFVPCSIDQYQAIYDMVDAVSAMWDKIGINGPPPRRPASLTRP